MKDNELTLVNDLVESNYQLGVCKTQIDMLVDIVYMKAEKIGKHERKYGYEMEDVNIDGSTILAIFRKHYPQRILDLFKDKPEEGDAVGTD